MDMCMHALGIFCCAKIEDMLNSYMPKKSILPETYMFF